MAGLPNSGAVMKTLDGKEPGDLLVVLVDVLEQYAVGPDAQPAVDAARARGALVGIQLLKRFLNALQAVLGLLRNRAAQVENSATTDRSGFAHDVGTELRGALKM